MTETFLCKRRIQSSTKESKFPYTSSLAYCFDYD